MRLSLDDKDRWLILFSKAVFLSLALAWLAYIFLGHRVIGAFYRNEPFSIEYYCVYGDLLAFGITKIVLIGTIFVLFLAEIIFSIPQERSTQEQGLVFQNPKPFLLQARSVVKEIFRKRLGIELFLVLILGCYLFYNSFNESWIHPMAQMLSQRPPVILRVLVKNHEALTVGFCQALLAPMLDVFLKALVVLGLFCLVTPRKHLKMVLVLLAVASVNLYLKFIPIIMVSSWGIYYAHFAGTLEVIHSCVTTRWFSPLLAHLIGFRTPQAWLFFLLVCFWVGISYLYIRMCQICGERKWAFLFALIPVATTLGWYGVYRPGYTDWALFMFLTFAVFVKRDLYSFMFMLLALCVHERGIFIVFFLPFVRPLFSGNFDRKEILENFLKTCVMIVCFLIFRKYMVLGNWPGYFIRETYWPGLLTGQSTFAPRPLTLVHIFIVIWEAYKAVLILGVAAFVALSRQRFHYKRYALLVISALFFVVPLQLLVAVDSVRLMDLWIFPVILLLFLCYREAPKFRRHLFALTVLALCINQILPARYVAENLAGVPPSYINFFWKNWTQRLN